MTVTDNRDDAQVDPGEALDWVDVCPLDALVSERGVAALVGERAVAIFRCSPDGRLFAIADLDPFSGASVLSRGLVGSIGDRRTVASPVHKQRFDLVTGVAVDDPAVLVDTWEVGVRGSRVLVARHPRTRPSATSARPVNGE